MFNGSERCAEDGGLFFGFEKPIGFGRLGGERGGKEI